ncbi:MAG: hypothetical protein GF416_08150 [Candidatus Altiarchaeales archaeon]|nr:hypothetical protein [Candidatus Altiarchaeales archaeon]MBD3417086.1 hypothetical protein [Candidatus Altiarchaeales archaeon]
MVSKKKRKKRKRKEEASISFSLGSLERIGGKLGEPLFLASVAALFLTAVKASYNEGLFQTGTPLMLFGLSLLSAYQVYNSKHLRRDVWSYGVPALILLAALFSHYSNRYPMPFTKDYLFFSLMAGIFLTFYALSYYGILRTEVALVLALFASTLLTHLAPAQSDYLAALDPYWHYKWMQGVYNEGYPPEFDDLVYPMYGGLSRHDDPSYIGDKGHTYGLEQRNTPMMTPVSYAVLGLVLKPFDVSLHDVAMVFPGVIAGFTIVAIYLLVKELFADMEPYNKVAGFAAAFMLMLSPAFAMKSVATNCEDDALGMFLMVAGLYLFFASYNRRSFKYSVLAGLTFMTLRMAWGGSVYVFTTIGVFGSLYAVVRFLQDKNAAEHLPYIVIPSVIAQFSGLILHARGGLPVVQELPPNAIYPMMGALGLPVILEMVRRRSNPMKLTGEKSLEGRSADWIEKNITALGVVALLLGVGAFTLYKSPADIVDFAKNSLRVATEKSVVHQTVAEQNPLADNFNTFLREGYYRYGLALLFGVLMIPVLAYMVYSRGSIGALFLLTWSAPMMYGAYHKSAWIFASSASITALGSTIGLFSIVRKEDFESLRVIGAVMLVAIPVFYVPTFGFVDYDFYRKFIGYQVMHMGPSGDRYYWEEALVWHRDHTDPGDAIMTWWDYGHWYSSYSHRPVLIDNLQADYYEIQDVARFFVNKTSEEEAFEIVKAYNDVYREHGRELKYVSIDWTMIPKGSALHYIANGDIDTETPAPPEWGWKNYATCSFRPDLSQLEEKLEVGEDGSFKRVKRVVFQCRNYVAGVYIEVEGDEITGVNVIDGYGTHISWIDWQNSQDSSLLGVQPLVGLNEERVPSILMCALNWNNVDSSSICRLPQFTTLVYVPQEFNDFMMTRLYLGKYLDEYKALGLYSREVKPLKHFRLVPDYDGDGMEDGEFSWGYVRSYEIDYGGFSTTTEASDETIIS